MQMTSKTIQLPYIFGNDLNDKYLYHKALNACMSVYLSACVSPNSSTTTGAFELRFGVKMHLTPVNVTIYIS